MTVLVASDLDRTLIYSRDAGGISVAAEGLACVEEYEGRPASYMTAGSARALAALARVAMFVPVTTRVPEQYARVRFPGPPPRYAVTANGGLLLVDGEPDPAWSREVTAGLRRTVPLAEVWAHVTRVCRAEFTLRLRNASDLFCYAIVRTGALPAGFVDDVTGWAAERGWRTSLQGRKLYWVPEALTKSAAVAEVGRRVGAASTLAAGDSLLDVDLLLGADRAIHPRHGELFEQGWSAPRVERTEQCGLRAGEEILAWFARHAASAVR
jgi:hypothetical protein